MEPQIITVLPLYFSIIPMYLVCCCSHRFRRNSFKKGIPWHIFALPWIRHKNTCKGQWVLHPYQVSYTAINRFRKGWLYVPIHIHALGHPLLSPKWIHPKGHLTINRTSFPSILIICSTNTFESKFAFIESRKLHIFWYQGCIYVQNLIQRDFYVFHCISV